MANAWVSKWASEGLAYWALFDKHGIVGIQTLDHQADCHIAKFWSNVKKKKLTYVHIDRTNNSSIFESKQQKLQILVKENKAKEIQPMCGRK